MTNAYSKLLYVLIFVVLSGEVQASQSDHVQDSILSLILESQQDTSLVSLYNKLGLLLINECYTEAKVIIDKAETLARKLKSDSGLATSLYTKGRNEAFNDHYNKGLNYIDQALEIYREIGDHNSIISCLVLLGWTNEKLANYIEALKNFEEGNSLCNKLNIKKNKANTLINIGRIHNTMGNFEIAVKYYDKSRNLYLAENDKEGLAFYYANVGFIYYQTDRYQLAIENYDKGLNLAKKLKLEKLEANLLNNKMASLNNSDQTNRAEELIDRITFLNSKYNNKIGMAYLEIEKAKISLKRNNANYDLAQLHEACDIGANTGDIELQQECAELLSEIYTVRGSFKNALEQFQLSESLKDSLAKAETMIKIRALEKDKSTQLKRKKQEIKQKELVTSLSNQRLIKRILAGLMVFLIAISILLYRLTKNTMRAKQQIEIKHSELEKVERKLAQKNEDLQSYIEHNIELEQFAHIASHDLKSPMRTISSFTGLLRKQLYDSITPKQKEQFDFISKGVLRLDLLIDDLLQFSVVNSQQLELETHSLIDIIEEVIENLEFVINESNAQITLPDNDIVLMADRIKIKQVFQNLLTNSIKFRSTDRPLVISITAKELEEYNSVSIDDNGIGIEHSHVDTVFEKFAQLNTKDKYEGTGLGLTLCKKYIDKHGGDIWVAPKDTPGTTIVFTINT